MRSEQFLFAQQLRQLGDIRRNPPRLVSDRATVTARFSWDIISRG
jgi:hypothetical protein